DVLAAAREAERLEAHRLQGDVAGQDVQVGPGDLLAVLLLDRPQQAAGLVEAAVVGPAVERGEALLAGPGAAAAVADAVGARAVPRHPDHVRAVVAEVGGPPVLGVGGELGDVPAHRREVGAVERLGVVEVLVVGVGDVGVLGEELQVEAVAPPAVVAAALGRVGSARVDDRAAAALRVVIDQGFLLLRHGVLPELCESGTPCGGTGGAQAPIDDLGLLDHEASAVGSGQAGHVADGAVDVGDDAARPAHDVVVVVTDPGLIAGHGPGRLDAP